MTREREPLPTRAAPFPDTRERVAEILTDGCAALPETGTGHAPPSLETVRALLERVTTTRLTRAQRERVTAANAWRTLANARTRDTVGRVFLQRLWWHGGHGSANLWSVYGAVFDIGRKQFETVDTVAAVFVHLFGRHGLKYTNNNRWRGLLCGSATWNAARKMKRDYEKGGNCDE